MNALRGVNEMPGAIHNYWLGIMALAFVLALVVWISLVFHAERHPVGKVTEPARRGEVTGGSFTAAEGGRQVTPDPTKEPVVPRPRGAPQAEPEPAAAGAGAQNKTDVNSPT
jgi:hypothetical protein